MSDKDKMRAEFEAYIKDKQISWLGRFKAIARQFFVAGYAAGRKAERESIQLKNWDGITLGTTNKPVGERWGGVNERARPDSEMD